MPPNVDYETKAILRESGQNVPKIALAGDRVRPKRAGSQVDGPGPAGAFRYREDEYVIILIALHQWPQIVRAMGKPELASDPRFKTASTRRNNRFELQAIIEQWLATFPTREAATAMDKERVSCAPVLTLERARAHGDLSENAEWAMAKQRQEFLRARLSNYELRIAELARINLDSVPRDTIGLGSKVEVEDLDEGTRTEFEIVVPEEVDASLNRISLASPLGKSMLGRGSGDDFEVQTPQGQALLCSHAFAHDSRSDRAGKRPPRRAVVRRLRRALWFWPDSDGRRDCAESRLTQHQPRATFRH
jgi:transcription elongation GreA/GreB family factor